ncbi:MAG: DUF3341 domain-containing protein [Acidobacteriota bacterium]|jgi:hypothetical protein
MSSNEGAAHAEDRLFGLLAEFSSADELLAGSRAVHESGYRRLDAFSPMPVEGLAEAIGYRSTGRLAKTVFAGGLVGAVGGFLLQYWIAAIDYPINVGGRPPNSWPAFIPVTFELTILMATFAAVLGMLAWNRLPMPYHPVFNVPRFKLATTDRFFLGVGSPDPLFDPHDTRALLEGLDGVVGVYEVDY